MHKIDWTKWSAVAEILSAVAIVATLIYLSVQTQQNTSALIATSRQSALDNEIAWLQSYIAYPVDLTDDSERAFDEQTRWNGFLLMALRIREYAWFQYQTGVLDEATWLSYMQPMGFMFSTDRAKRLLEGYGGDPEFKEYVRAWLDQGR